MNVDALLLIAGEDRWDHMYGSGGSWMWMWVFGVSMMVLLVVSIVWLVRTTAHGTAPPDSTGRAREILAERYARGELTTEEYRDRLEQLR